jgi:hypothetical protein
MSLLSDDWQEFEKSVRYVICDDPEFVVFIDKEFKIEWRFTPKFNRSIQRMKADIKKKHFHIMTQAAVVDTLPSDGLSDEDKLRFRRLVGEAIAICFEGLYENAADTLNFARQYLRERSEELSRYWYLSSSIIFCAPFFLVAVGLWLVRPAASLFLGPQAFWLAIVSCAGTFGALLSVVSRTGKLNFSSSSGLALHRLEALSRISVGALSGGLVDLAIQSKLFLPSLSDGSKAHVVTVIAAFAAGASERLAPSIIAQFDRKPA